MDATKSTMITFLLCAYLSSYVYIILSGETLPNTDKNIRRNVNTSLQRGLNLPGVEFKLLHIQKVKEGNIPFAGFIIVACKNTLYVAFKGTTSTMETKANATASNSIILKHTSLQIRNGEREDLWKQAGKHYEKNIFDSTGYSEKFIFPDIHKGLYYTFLKNNEYLKEKLEKLLRDGTYSRVVFTGHSMGAWLAAFANIHYCNFISQESIQSTLNKYSRTQQKGTGSGARIDRKLVFSINNREIHSISICFSLPPLQVNVGTMRQAGALVTREGWGKVRGALRRNIKQGNQSTGKQESISNYIEHKALREGQKGFIDFRKEINSHIQNYSSKQKSAKNPNEIEKLKGNALDKKVNNLCRFSRRSNIRTIQFNFAHDPVSDGFTRSLLGQYARAINCARTIHDYFTTTMPFNTKMNKLEEFTEMVNSPGAPQVARHSMSLYLLCLIYSISDSYNNGQFSPKFRYDKYILDIEKNNNPDFDYLKQSLKLHDDSKMLFIYNLFSNVNFQYAKFLEKIRDSQHVRVFKNMFSENSLASNNATNDENKFYNATNNKNKFYNAQNEFNNAQNNSRTKGKITKYHIKNFLQEFKRIFKASIIKNSPADRKIIDEWHSFINNYVQNHKLSSNVTIKIKKLFSKGASSITKPSYNSFMKKLDISHTIAKVTRMLNESDKI